MTQAHQQALDEARNAGIDLELMDTLLALSPKERCLQHDAASTVVQEYEDLTGKKFSELAIIRIVRTGVRPLVEVRDQEVWALI